MPRCCRPSRGGQGQRDIPPFFQSQPGPLGEASEGRAEARGALGLSAPAPREELRQGAAAHAAQVSAVGGRRWPAPPSAQRDRVRAAHSLPPQTYKHLSVHAERLVLILFISLFKFSFSLFLSLVLRYVVVSA